MPHVTTVNHFALQAPKAEGPLQFFTKSLVIGNVTSTF